MLTRKLKRVGKKRNFSTKISTLKVQVSIFFKFQRSGKILLTDQRPLSPAHLVSIGSQDIKKSVKILPR